MKRTTLSIQSYRKQRTPAQKRPKSKFLELLRDLCRDLNSQSVHFDLGGAAASP